MSAKIPTKAAIVNAAYEPALGVRAQANTAPEPACACSGDPDTGLERSVWLRALRPSAGRRRRYSCLPYRRLSDVESSSRAAPPVELTNAQRAVSGWLYSCCRQRPPEGSVWPEYSAADHAGGAESRRPTRRARALQEARQPCTPAALVAAWPIPASLSAAPPPAPPAADAAGPSGA